LDYYGVLANVASLLVVALGLVSQITLNFRRKSCKGLSLPMMGTCALAYLLWGIYGWHIHDWYVTTAQVVGFVAISIILLQFWLYRSGTK